MRLLHGSDFHLGLTRYSRLGTTSRADDLCETLGRFVDVAVTEKVDVAILSGDTFHGRKPVPRDFDALTKALSQLSRAGITVVVSEGNHDGKDVVGDPRSAAIGFLSHVEPPGVHVITHPFAGLMQTLSGQVFNLVSTPYPHKNAFDAVMPDADLPDRIEAISRALEQSIITMMEQVDPKAPTIFVGHLSTLGAALGSEVSMRFGWDVAVRSAIFDDIEYAALGHIHRQQQVGDRAWYAGSPDYIDFGEMNQTKGFLLVDIEKGVMPKVTVVDSNSRPMAEVEANWSVEDGWVLKGDVPEGAIVRVTAHVQGATQPSDMESLSRQIRDLPASYVKTEYVKVGGESAEAKPLISRTATGAEALKMWLQANGHDIEPALTLGAELLSRVAETEDVGGSVDV